MKVVQTHDENFEPCIANAHDWRPDTVTPGTIGKDILHIVCDDCGAHVTVTLDEAVRVLHSTANMAVEGAIARRPWLRVRFRANENDYRPVKWPPAGPYWCSGYGDGYAIVVAYIPVTTILEDYWPEATHIDEEAVEDIVFTDRFPRPDWWEQP